MTLTVSHHYTQCRRKYALRLKAVLLLLLLAYQIPLHALSVQLSNDTPYPLTASIVDAKGHEIATHPIEPHTLSRWQEQDSGYQEASHAKTPLKVRLHRKNGELYSTWYIVHSGSLVEASKGEGAKRHTLE